MLVTSDFLELSMNLMMCLFSLPGRDNFPMHLIGEMIGTMSLRWIPVSFPR